MISKKFWIGLVMLVIAITTGLGIACLYSGWIGLVLSFIIAFSVCWIVTSVYLFINGWWERYSRND